MNEGVRVLTGSSSVTLEVGRCGRHHEVDPDKWRVAWRCLDCGAFQAGCGA